MRGVERIKFPCDRVPEDAATARLLGLYEQRQEGLFMQRVKIHAGRVSPLQWRTLAELAGRYTPGYPLHVTTRQDVELHGLKPQDVPAVQHSLAAAGLTTLGACGDTLRNVTACPGNGLCHGTFNVAAIADAIRAAAESLPWILTLPRKFKISISACEKACARPWINDVGLVAKQDGTMAAMLAGSLGARPGTGLALYRSMDPADAVPLVVAALALFNAQGDRQNRARARLRHVRERLGDAAFRTQLAAHFRQESKNRAWPRPELARAEGKAFVLARLQLPLGDIQPEPAIELAHAAEEAGAALRLGLDHDVFLYGRSALKWRKSFRSFVGQPRVVACPGSAWCRRGITDSRAAAQQIRGALCSGRSVGVRVSGCPNDCAQAAVADIGLVGRVKTVAGARQECYRLLAGGGKGQTAGLAQELHPGVPVGEMPALVTRLADEYATSRQEGDSFAQFVAQRKDRLCRAP